MTASSTYLATIKKLATDAAIAKKAIYDANLTAAASGTFGQDASGNVTYTPGDSGTLDTGYKRGSRNLEGSLESRGLLKSGEGATKRGEMASDYTTSVLDYYRQNRAARAGIDTDLAAKLGEYDIQYGADGGNDDPGPGNTEYTPPAVFNPTQDYPVLGSINQSTGQPGFGYTKQPPEKTNDPIVDNTAADYYAAAAMGLGQAMNAGAYAPYKAPKAPALKKPARRK
jgi:hypothetical protein